MNLLSVSPTLTIPKHIIIISTIVGIAIALFTWIVLKPIIRAIGWLISGVTILAFLYWL